MSLVRHKLKEMFKDTGAFKLAPPGEPFTLASGKKSDYYIDCRKVLLQPRGNRLATFAMNCLITDYLYDLKDEISNVCIGTTGVGGAPLLGGILFSMGATDRYSGFVVRDVQKEHGLKRQIEGHVDKDSKIIMIDDVLTTGGSILKACVTLDETFHVKPHVVMVLVDREEGVTESLKLKLGCDVLSVFKVSEFLVDQPVAAS